MSSSHYTTGILSNKNMNEHEICNRKMQDETQ